MRSCECGSGRKVIMYGSVIVGGCGLKISIFKFMLYRWSTDINSNHIIVNLRCSHQTLNAYNSSSKIKLTPDVCTVADPVNSGPNWLMPYSFVLTVLLHSGSSIGSLKYGV